MYDEVLVPTDGSEASNAAVEHGVGIGEAYEATVHFLYVVDLGTEMSASGIGTIADDLTETLEGEAEDALDEAQERAGERGVACDRTVLEGIPHEAIIEYGTDNDIVLIVMGSSGRSGLKEHLLGSTTDRVVRTAEMPVLLTHP